jgi:hypothetical protein
MQTTSNEFKVTISQPSRELAARITFSGLSLDAGIIQRISLISTLVSGSEFQIGTASADKITLDLIDDTATLINFDFKGEEFELELGITLPDTSIEFVSLGLFTVDGAVRNRDVITIEAIDRMYKFEKQYVNDLVYPATLLQIAQSACAQAGVTLVTTEFTNAGYTVPNEPVFEGVTSRKVMASIAELAGGYAKIDRTGLMRIITLGTLSARDITPDHYIDYTINELAEGIIDKVVVKVGAQEAEAGAGVNPYYIIDNMFVQNPADVASSLYDVLSQVNYTAGHLRWIGDFSLDLHDRIMIDDKATYVMNRGLNFTGGLREEYKALDKSNVVKNSTGKGSLTLDINRVKTQVQIIDGLIKETVESVTGLNTSMTAFEQDFESFKNTIQIGGGNNIIKNSVGYGEDLNFWTLISGAVDKGTSTWILEGIAKHGWILSDGDMYQDLDILPGKDYTLSGRLIKYTQAGSILVGLYDPDTDVLVHTAIEKVVTEVYDGQFSYEFNAEAYRKLRLKITAVGVSSVDPAELTDLMMAQGNNLDVWSQANGEIYTLNVKMDSQGVTVYSADNKGKTVMSPDEFAGYYNNSKIFTLNGDITEVMGLDIGGKGLFIRPVKFVQATTSMDIVWTGV